MKQMKTSKGHYLWPETLRKSKQIHLTRSNWQKKSLQSPSAHVKHGRWARERLSWAACEKERHCLDKPSKEPAKSSNGGRKRKKQFEKHHLYYLLQSTNKRASKRYWLMQERNSMLRSRKKPMNSPWLFPTS